MFLSLKRDSLLYFFKGVYSGFPLVLGYFPVAVAFGLSARGAGFSGFDAVVMSAVVFAGASQFVLVSMLGSGASFLFAFFICSALNLRHVVYGPGLSSRLSKYVKPLVPVLSFGLTDEVFSTCIAQVDKIEDKNQGFWLLGLEFTAYFTWVSATFAGAFLGEIAVRYLPFVETAFSFSLPALFLILLYFMLDKKKFFPVILCVGATLLMMKLDAGAYSVLVCAVLGPCVHFLIKKGLKDGNKTFA